MIDFAPFGRGEVTIAQLAAPLTRADLIALTNEMIDAEREIVATAGDADVVFVPSDPQAYDTFAAPGTDVSLPWTLGHVIVHATASSEESAALALDLARGVAVSWRSRYEVAWESVTTSAQVLARLEESRRMRLAMLEAWPDEPQLENTYTPIPRFGPINAVGRVLFGLYHDDSHLDQLREIMAQARRVRAA